MNDFLIIYNARLVDAKMDSPGAVVVENGKISGIFLGDASSKDVATNVAVSSLSFANASKAEFFDAKGLTLMPSFIDMHAHFRYPGQTQKEDLDSGLKAAVAGGFGTLVLMPNTTPVISDFALAKKVMDEAKEKNLARIYQTLSITKDFAGKDTSGLDNINAADVPVVSEDGHDVESAAIMLEAMKKAGKKNIIVACHCEDVSLAQAAKPYRQRALGFMKQYGIPAGKVHVKVPDVPGSVEFEIDGNLTTANKLLALAEDAATERNIEIAKLAECHTATQAI